MTCHAEASGRKCEQMAADICLSLGYRVTPAPGKQLPWDLNVNGLRVQVKERTWNAHLTCNIEMKTSARKNGFAYLVSEVDAFAILMNGAWYVFPSSVVARPDGTIPNNITVSRIVPFMDSWHLLNGGTHITERQLGFDF